MMMMRGRVVNHGVRMMGSGRGRIHLTMTGVMLRMVMNVTWMRKTGHRIGSRSSHHLRCTGATGELGLKLLLGCARATFAGVIWAAFVNIFRKSVAGIGDPG